MAIPGSSGSVKMSRIHSDVPPLEDLSEYVEKAKAMRSQIEEATTAVPARSEDERHKNAGSSKSDRQSESTAVKKDSTAASFGGLKKGFLFASAERSDRKKPATRTTASSSSKPNASAADGKSSPKTSAAEGSGAGKSSRDSQRSSPDDIPFLKPKDGQRSKGMEFPEVQEAMKESYPFLRSQDWVTDDLLARIEKHPLLSKAFQDPSLSRVLVEFQSNPQKVMAAARENPEIQKFLQEFCSVMGDHFTALADEEERAGSGGGASSKEHLISEATTSTPEDAAMRATLQRPEVQRVLADPAIQRLIMTLKSNPDAAQRIVQSAGPELRQKMKVLIDNGLLGIQRL